MTSSEQLEHIVQIPLQEILLTTNGFSKERNIGMGSFGQVYKGNSEKYGDVAIKRLHRGEGQARQGDHQFRTEITLLSEYKHENIVSLIGFCDEDGEMILVYRYESKGSLDKYLKNKDLTWIQRLRICLDAALGLKYLHDDVGPQQRILHRDVKSANILLDDNWKAKISDFGLSRLGPANMQTSFLFSEPCGTPGYIDPDYFNGYLTQKSDVFSFGVVLFEVLCGRLANATVNKDDPTFYVLAQNHYQRQTLEKIILNGLSKQISEDSLLLFSTIAYECLKTSTERPTMNKVVEQLQKALDKQLNPSLIMAASSIPHRWKYDVFVSFRGEDIRKTFADHLFRDFMKKGIRAFRDDDELPGGGEISPQLYKAIEESWILMVILSEHYAHSSWCLRELAKILERKQMQNPKHEVRIIFYNVTPDVVRKQKGSYAKAFAKHEILNSSEVAEWKKALSMAADLSVWYLGEFTNGSDLKFIDSIIKEVHIIRRHAQLPIIENIVAVDVRVKKLNLWKFMIGSSKVHMIGISGVSGIGKTTLAKAIYNSMYIHFDGSSFCDNIQGVSKRECLTHFQKQLIADITKEDPEEISNVRQQIAAILKMMPVKPILLVLDDVDHRDQLEALAGSPNWFSPGSLIIFTSKDKKLLRSHGVDAIYDMDFHNDDESLELFLAYALQEKHS